MQVLKIIKKLMKLQYNIQTIVYFLMDQLKFLASYSYSVNIYDFNYYSTYSYEQSNITSIYISINQLGNYSFITYFKVKDFLGDPNELELILLNDNDLINATNFDDYIFSKGSDQIFGNGGNDKIDGGSGDDETKGGWKTQLMEEKVNTVIFNGKIADYNFSSQYWINTNI